jgi:hypothetical protein
MTGVKPLAGLALDHLGDPRQGPQVGRKPVGQRAAAERQIDPRQLPVIQTRLAAQAAGRLPARAALPRPGLIHRHAVMGVTSRARATTAWDSPAQTGAPPRTGVLPASPPRVFWPCLNVAS